MTNENDKPDAEVDKQKYPLRIGAPASDRQNQEFWVDHLKKSGMEILSQGLTGIDARGTIQNIKDALDVEVTVSESGIQLEGQTSIVSREDAQPPIAYVPRKPEFFSGE